MNEQLKQKWIEALRSGKYLQGKRLLRRNDTYCCLGVLYDIVNGEWIKEEVGFSTKDGELCLLSDEFLESVGLDETYITLAHLNDEGSSFEEISKIIERL